MRTDRNNVPDFYPTTESAAYDAGKIVGKNVRQSVIEGFSTPKDIMRFVNKKTEQLVDRGDIEQEYSYSFRNALRDKLFKRVKASLTESRNITESKLRRIVREEIQNEAYGDGGQSKQKTTF